MQKFDQFRRHLKRKGKKNHVVEDLVSRCNMFEEFLRRKQKSSIDRADKEDVEAFCDEIKDRKAGVNNYLRAISLYYRFKSRPELADLAGNLREQRISSKRKLFELKKFRGINKEHAKLLEREGIVNVNQMLERGKTPHDRKELAEKTGIPLESILEYVKLSDLCRLGAIKSVRARLYFDAGVDTPDKIASWDPEELRKMLVSFVRRTGFDGVAPLPKELRNAVETARGVRRIVDYDESSA
jgi:hypothetical protein